MPRRDAPKKEGTSHVRHGGLPYKDSAARATPQGSSAQQPPAAAARSHCSATRRHGIVEPGRLLRRRCERHSALMCAAFRPQHRPRASSQRCEHVIDAVDRLLLLRRSLRPSPSRWQCLGACGGCTGSAFGVLGLRRDASWSVRTPRCSGTPQRGGDGSVPCNRCSANARCSRRPRAWRRRCGHDEASA